jgi:hypothetical protein
VVLWWGGGTGWDEGLEELGEQRGGLGLLQGQQGLEGGTTVGQHPHQHLVRAGWGGTKKKKMEEKENRR